tara:strand:+ start:2024 stop:3133 length:1110 start_codon:yes stop_codon:yes gene_type:complete
MANSNLLKEAIADAKAVRETAIANAKIALEEAFTPRLQSILSQKLTAEMEGEEEEADLEEENVVEATEEVNEEEAEEVEETVTESEEDESEEAVEETVVTEEDESEEGEEVSEGEEEEEVEETMESEEEVEETMESEEDEDELDLESIIRELEGELGEELDDEETEEVSDIASDEIESHEEEHHGEEEAADEVEESHDDESEESDDEEIDLDEILREMGYGDDEVSEDEEDEEEEAVEENNDLEEAQAELAEAMSTIKSLKGTINEVNLLNAKLLYTNKLFRSYELTNEQKMKVVETLDRTGNVREVKLVFSTLAESFKFTGTTKKQKSAKINESFASKPVASTAPSKEVITESTNTMADRFKQLANIK